MPGRKHDDGSKAEVEDRYRVLVEAAPFCIHEIDLDGRLVAMNAAGLRMMGVDDENEIIGLDYMSIPKHDDQANVAAHFADALLGKPSSFEFEIETETGAVFLDSGFVPLRDDHGEVVKIMGVTQDITERKQAERELQLSRNRLQAIFDHAPVEIHLKDAEGRYVQVNRQFELFFNVRNEDIVGLLPEDVHCPELGREARKHDLQVLESGMPRAVEEKVVTELGERIHHVVKFPISGAREVAGLGAVVTDITDLMRVQNALAESDERLRQAAGLAGLGYSIWDSTADRCTYCSDEYARVHGVSTEQYLDMASSLEGSMTCVHPEDRTGVLKRIELAEHEGFLDHEYRILTPGGDVRFVREFETKAPRRDGESVEWICTIQDITKYKLAEEQLRETHKMRALGQLTGGVAHDFNNLLGIISGTAELIASGKPDDTGELIQRILRAARNGAELTQQLLAFSRRQPLNPQITDLRKVISDLPTFLERTLGKNIAIEIDVPQELWAAFVDRNQLQNALLNLAINARDAMRDGGTLTISARNRQISSNSDDANPDLEFGDYVALTVRDDGTGMSPEVLSSAFEPFFTTKDFGQGSGLGLSMVYGFTKQSGGHVTIDSKHGGGTAVTLYLSGLREVVQSKPAARSSNLPTGEGEVILVIEDNEDMSEVVSSMLRELNYQAIMVRDVAGAREVLKTADVALLLTDVVLPGGMNGLQFAEELKSNMPELRVLLMSGFSGGRSSNLAGLGSDQPLLRKPFSMVQLAGAVQAAIGENVLASAR